MQGPSGVCGGGALRYSCGSSGMHAGPQVCTGALWCVWGGPGCVHGPSGVCVGGPLGSVCRGPLVCVCVGPRVCAGALWCVWGGPPGVCRGPQVCAGARRCSAAVPSTSPCERPSSVLRERGWRRITCFRNCSGKQGLCRSGWRWQSTDTRGDTRGPSLNTWGPGESHSHHLGAGGFCCVSATASPE